MSLTGEQISQLAGGFAEHFQEHLLQRKAANQLSADHLEIQKLILAEQQTANLIAFAQLQHAATGRAPEALITRIREQIES